VADFCEHGNEPSVSVKGWVICCLLSTWATVSFSRRTLLHRVSYIPRTAVNHKY